MKSDKGPKTTATHKRKNKYTNKQTNRYQNYLHTHVPNRIVILKIYCFTQNLVKVKVKLYLFLIKQQAVKT